MSHYWVIYNVDLNAAVLFFILFFMLFLADINILDMSINDMNILIIRVRKKCWCHYISAILKGPLFDAHFWLVFLLFRQNRLLTSTILLQQKQSEDFAGILRVCLRMFEQRLENSYKNLHLEIHKVFHIDLKSFSKWHLIDLEKTLKIIFIFVFFSWFILNLNICMILICLLFYLIFLLILYKKIKLLFMM